MGRGARGGVVAKVLCYKPEGRCLETQRHCISSIYEIRPIELGSAVYPVPSRNEYEMHKYKVFLGNGAWPMRVLASPPSVSRCLDSVGTLKSLKSIGLHPVTGIALPYFLSSSNRNIH
jgi:hypothetical protein